jgi:heme exporter protein A
MPLRLEAVARRHYGRRAAFLGVGRGRRNAVTPVRGDRVADRFEAQELGCVRGGRAVFGGLGFALDAGGALVLRGPNGSGKSSLLRILAGLLRPTNGRLLWNGATVRETPDEHRARLHFVSHLDSVKPLMTAAETLGFLAVVRGERAAASMALDRLGIRHLADVPGRFLSAGQKRRVALARLVASPARLWLLDEPTVTLDAEAIGRLEAIMAEHRKSGGMVIAATHTDITVESAEQLDLGRFRSDGKHAAPRPDAAAAIDDETW